MYGPTQRALELITNNDILSFDMESSGTNPYVDEPAGFVVGTATEAVYVPTHHFDQDNVPEHEYQMLLKKLQDKKLVMHSAAFDYRMVRKYGITLPVFADTLLMAYSTGEYFELGLKELVLLIFKYRMATFSSLFSGSTKDARMLPVNVLTPYAEDDGIYTMRLYDYLERTMTKKAKAIYSKIEMPCLPYVIKMMDVGFPVNPDFMRDEGYKLQRAARAAEAIYHGLIAHRFDMSYGTAKTTFPIKGKGSLSGIRKLLYDKNYLNLEPLKRSPKTGNPSTDEDSLKVYRDAEQIVNALLTWRELSNRERNYFKYADMAIDGFLKANLNQHGASSGRFSSDKPNLQNWSKHTKWVISLVEEILGILPDKIIQDIKEFLNEDNDFEFIENFRNSCQAPDGYYILQFDFSQIEYRILQGYIQSPRLKRIFDEEGDIHNETAMFCFNIKYDEITKEIRDDSKTINYALNYGMGVPHFFRELGGKYTMQETATLHGRYFQLYPEMTAFHNTTRAETDKTYSVETYFGRHQIIPEYYSKRREDLSKARRAGVNRKVQGTAADIMKIAIIRVGRMLEKKWPDVKMFLTVHDSLLFLVPEEIDRVQLATDMAAEAEIQIPGFPAMRVDFESDKMWGSMEEFEIPRKERKLTKVSVALNESYVTPSTMSLLKATLGKPGDTTVSISVNGSIKEYQTSLTLQEIVQELSSKQQFTVETEYEFI